MKSTVFCLSFESNPLVETGILDSVHVVECIHTNGTRLYCVGTNTKFQYIYPGYRAAGVHVEGGGGSDRYPH